MSFHRDRLAPFTDDELALQQSFADQAVIAIENARLFNETQEALERQTATADILKVIASSPADVQPVFEAIAAAPSGCSAAYSVAVFRLIDDNVHLAAHTPTNPAADEALEADFPSRSKISRPSGWRSMASRFPYRTPKTCRTQPLRDIARLHRFPQHRCGADNERWHAIGSSPSRAPSRARSRDHHVQLLETFADQAVIAIENARLFNETQEALERQTATSEILKVIASSPSDVQPVFDAIAESARRLLGSFTAVVTRVHRRHRSFGGEHRRKRSDCACRARPVAVPNCV